MPEGRPQYVAFALLRFAIRIAPPNLRDWGRAMMGELYQVEGTWGQLTWAIGCSNMLARNALAAFIIPGHSQQALVPDGNLFARSSFLRNAALLLGGACLLLSVVFLASPPFRIGLEFGLHPWLSLMHVAPAVNGPGFQFVAREAEAEHDAQALALCAVRVYDSPESARLAEEAVHLDRNLTWVYAVVAMRHPELPQAGAWVKKVESWDPQNALFPLITADSLVRIHFPRAEASPADQQLNTAWRSAMGAAFRCPKFDDYFDRIWELNRTVVQRYRFNPIDEVISRVEIDLPPLALENSTRFAHLLIESGREFEARGDLTSASQEYRAVARYGRMIDYQAHTLSEDRCGVELQAIAYEPLRALSEREGKSADAEMFSYLARKFNSDAQDNKSLSQESTFHLLSTRRNAAVVEVSGLMLLIFAILLLGATLVFTEANRRTQGGAASDVKPAATMAIMTSGVGLLFFSITLYLTFHPYWYAIRSAMQNGDQLPSRDLQAFIIPSHMPPGAPTGLYSWLDDLFYFRSPDLPFFIWIGLTVLGLIGLAFIVLRHLLRRQSPEASY